MQDDAVSAVSCPGFLGSAATVAIVPSQGQSCLIVAAFDLFWEGSIYRSLLMMSMIRLENCADCDEDYGSCQDANHICASELQELSPSWTSWAILNAIIRSGLDERRTLLCCVFHRVVRVRSSFAMSKKMRIPRHNFFDIIIKPPSRSSTCKSRMQHSAEILWQFSNKVLLHMCVTSEPSIGGFALSNSYRVPICQHRQHAFPH